mgnify:CR=1 FL=1
MIISNRVNIIIIMNDGFDKLANCLIFIVPFMIILWILKCIIDFIILIMYKIFGNPDDA